MTTDFEQLRREADRRGMADYERGKRRDENPHAGQHATDEAEFWYLGWDNAAELARVEHATEQNIKG